MAAQAHAAFVLNLKIFDFNSKQNTNSARGSEWKLASHKRNAKLENRIVWIDRNSNEKTTEWLFTAWRKTKRGFNTSSTKIAPETINWNKTEKWRKWYVCVGGEGAVFVFVKEGGECMHGRMNAKWIDEWPMFRFRSRQNDSWCFTCVLKTEFSKIFLLRMMTWCVHKPAFFLFTALLSTASAAAVVSTF